MLWKRRANNADKADGTNKSDKAGALAVDCANLLVCLSADSLSVF